jgi:4-hydroxythreonine-4-phosphate dehydrogenase
MNPGRRPRIAFFAGDPNGIGPELVAKLLSRPEAAEGAAVRLIGDRAVLAGAERLVGAMIRPDIAFESLPGCGDGVRTPGKVNRAAGAWTLAGLRRCAALARNREADAIVFAPLNKQALKLGGLTHPDEQHLFAELLGAGGYTVEFNVIDRLWTSRVTSHIPLRDVAGTITAARVADAVRVIHRGLRQGGIARPRIGVAGLNPHAGEGGTLGREEIDAIEPGIARARAEGIDARGPFPADTIFIAARRGDFDAVVTMYHDQGQIAMKLMGFDRGVTVLGGLPVPVTTCAHGTAYDIVGRNAANPVPLANAFALAIRMATRPNGVERGTET